MINENLSMKMQALSEYVLNNKPLVHCLTNTITINDNANIILAVGASPIMADHPKEVAEITAQAQSLVINIGNITDARIESIFIAGEAAIKAGIPIVFDPVGVACSSFRQTLAEKIIVNLQPQIIKGNMSEIKALAKISVESIGVDVSPGDIITENTLSVNLEIVKNLARKYNCVVVATGAYDLVADAQNYLVLANGSTLLEKITGTGCMCAALLGVYAASKLYFVASVLAITQMNVAAEFAEKDISTFNQGIGSFKVKLFDYIYKLKITELIEGGIVK